MSNSENIVSQQQQIEVSFFQQHKKIIIFLCSIWVVALAIAMFGLVSLVNPGRKLAQPQPQQATTFSQPIKSPKQVESNGFFWLFVKVLGGCAAGSLAVTYVLRSNFSSPTSDRSQSEVKELYEIETPVLTEIEEAEKKEIKEISPLPPLIKHTNSITKEEERDNQQISFSSTSEKHEINLPLIQLRDKQTKGRGNSQENPVPTLDLDRIDSNKERTTKSSFNESEKESLSFLLQSPSIFPKAEPSTIAEEKEKKAEESNVTVIPAEQPTPLDLQEPGLAEIMDLRKRHSLSSLMEEL